MKILLALAAALLCVLCTNVVNAEEQHFYFKKTDAFWSVYGANETTTGQATCFGEAGRKDGSIIQIHRSLVDGELWVVVHGTEWEIQSQGGGTLRWNFYAPGSKGDLIAGADLHYEVKDKNTIQLLQIKPNAFSDALWNSKYFVLVMPGNLPNLLIGFETRGSTMLSALAECIKQNEKKFKDPRPPLEKIPDAIKEQL